VLSLAPGPRTDWFGDAGLDRLTGQAWSVSSDSNRIGVRLEGRPVPRLVEGELPSEGLVHGAVQVPASGLPVVFLTDHPVTGGYPVIGVVVEADLPVAGQLVPGQQVRFRVTG
jgi:allophanate hydrolase subunit 2